MKTLSVRQVIILHETMIKKHGGSSGVRDQNMLESAVHRPLATFSGDDLYPDIYSKTAALIQSIVGNHPFIDGNKRTSYVSAFTILKSNNIKITASPQQIVTFMVKIASQNLSVDEIASWLRSHTT